MERQRNNYQVAYEMTKALTKRPRTVAQLSEISGLSVQAVRHWLRKMKAAGAVRVVRYSTDSRGRKFAPVWGMGGGEDAPRPGRAAR